MKMIKKSTREEFQKMRHKDFLNQLAAMTGEWADQRFQSRNGRVKFALTDDLARSIPLRYAAWGHNTLLPEDGKLLASLAGVIVQVNRDHVPIKSPMLFTDVGELKEKWLELQRSNGLRRRIFFDWVEEPGWAGSVITGETA